MVTIRAAIPDIKPAEHTNEWTAELLQKKKFMFWNEQTRVVTSTQFVML